MVPNNFPLLVLISAMALVACNGKQSDSADETDAAAKALPKEHIFSAQERALRKAQALNTVVDEHDQEMRKKLGEAFK